MPRFARLVHVAIGAMAIMLVMSPRPAQAQKLELSFHEGSISLGAQDVTLREVLDEWARLGGTRVVNADLLGATRVSLKLERVPEAEAIHRILESAAGYAARRRRGTAGASDFELIVVLATSDVPADAAAEKNTDSTSQARWHVEAPPLASSYEVTSSAPQADPDADADSTIFSNEATGRAPGSRPFQGHFVPRVAAVPASAEELPAGRPEGARPGTPPAVVVDPTALTPPAAAPAVSGEAHDVNGRPIRKP